MIKLFSDRTKRGQGFIADHYTILFSVAEHNPRFVDIRNLQDAKREIESIGCAPESVDIMAPKAVFRIIKLDDVLPQDAIIIKQDMLSIGGEVAIPRDVFELRDKSCSILIMGTVRQLYELAGKLDRHYMRIRRISSEILDVIERHLLR